VASVHWGKSPATGSSLRVADRTHIDDGQPGNTSAFPLGRYPIGVGPQDTSGRCRQRVLQCDAN
jgi:hypothetical protein